MKFCKADDDFCNVDKALGNLQKNALSIISKVMQISELAQKSDKLITPEELEETATSIGETLGGVFSDLIDFRTI